MLIIPTQFQSATHTQTSNDQTVRGQAGDRQAPLSSSKTSPGIQFANRFMQLEQGQNPASGTLGGTPQENTAEPAPDAGPDDLAELEAAQPETGQNAVDALGAGKDLPDQAAISIPGDLVAASRAGPAGTTQVSGTGAGTATQDSTKLTAQNPGFAIAKQVGPGQAGQAPPPETGAAPAAGAIDPALAPTPPNAGTGGADNRGVAPGPAAGTSAQEPPPQPRGALAVSASDQSPALSGNRADPPLSQPTLPAQTAPAGGASPPQAPGLTGTAPDRFQPLTSLVNGKTAGALPLQGAETGGQTLAGASLSTQSARNVAAGAPVPPGTNGQTPEPLRPRFDAVPLGDGEPDAAGLQFITDPDGVSATLRDSLQLPLSRLDAAVQVSTTGSMETPGARPEVARSVAAQIVEVLVRQPDRPVQISLNPEELGRVRMALSTSETGVTVTIAAERSETLDLMRRHIDLLALEFRRLGFDNIGFEFSGGSGDQFSDPDGESPAPTQAPAAPDTDTTAPPKRLVSAGLDLRL